MEEKKLYPSDWIGNINKQEISELGRDFEAARRYIQAAVPPGGVPLTKTQLVGLICGTMMPTKQRKRYLNLKNEIAKCEDQYELMEDGSDKDEMVNVINRLKVHLQAIHPPHFGARPRECIRRVIAGEPVISPPEVRSLRKKEVAKLVDEEIEKRFAELNPPSEDPEIDEV